MFQRPLRGELPSVVLPVCAAALVAAACGASAPAPTVTTTAPAPTPAPAPAPAPAPPPGAADTDALQYALAAAVIAHDEEALRRLVIPADVLATICAGDVAPIALTLETAARVRIHDEDGVRSRLDSRGWSGPHTYTAGQVLDAPGATCQLTRAVQVGSGNVVLEHRRADAQAHGALDARSIAVDGRWYLFTDVPLHTVAQADAYAVRDRPIAGCRSFANRVELLRGNEPDADSVELCDSHDAAYAACARDATTAASLDRCGHAASAAACAQLADQLVALLPAEHRDETRAKIDADPSFCAPITAAHATCTALASTLDRYLACFDPIE